MSTFIGTSQPNSYYIGTTPLSALYVGTNQIWPVGQEVTHFDFGNGASYPGAGTSIYNISANKNYVVGNLLTMSVYQNTGTPLAIRTDPSGSGTMFAISASSGNYGNYLFPTTVTAALEATSSTFTFETWIRPYQKKADGNGTLSGPNHSPIWGLYNNWQFGISNANTNDGAMVCIQNNAQNTITTVTSASSATGVVNFNQWNHLVYTATRNSNNTTTFTFYSNGIQRAVVNQNLTTLTATGWTYISPGHITNLIFGLYDISQWKTYNKVISAADVVSNFNSQRGRYGI